MGDESRVLASEDKKTRIEIERTIEGCTIYFVVNDIDVLAMDENYASAAGMFQVLRPEDYGADRETWAGGATEDPPDDNTGILTDDGASYEDDEFIGKKIIITSGTAKGDIFEIDDNTSTTIVCTGDNLYAAGIRNTDTYRVFTDCTQPIQDALDALDVGDILAFKKTDDTNFYSITDVCNITTVTGNKWSLLGPGRAGAEIRQLTDNKTIFTIGTAFKFNANWKITGLVLNWETQQTSSDTDSYGIKFVGYIPETGCVPYFGTIEDLQIDFGYRGIGCDTNAGDTIVPWQLSIRDVVTYDMIGATIFFKSPVASGMPNNTFENVYVSRRNITPSEAGFKLYVQSEGSMLNCAVEGGEGQAVDISSCPSFTVKDMHFESFKLNDTYGVSLVGISETNLLWDGGSISADEINVAGNAEIFKFYSAGSYPYAIIRGVRERATSVTGGYYFVRSTNDAYNISLENIDLTACDDFYKELSDTGETIRTIDGVYAKNQYTYTTEGILTIGQTYLRPSVGAADTTHTLDDGDIIGTHKHIRKGGSTYQSTVTITNHQLGSDIVREFIGEDSYMDLYWNGTHWSTIAEELNNNLFISASGAIPPNGTALHHLHSAAGDLALTLANADRADTTKFLRKNVDANECTITIATHVKGASYVIVLEDADDYLHLKWNNYYWVTLGLMIGGETILESSFIEDSAPTFTMYNNTAGDGDYARASRIIYQGITGATVHTLGKLEIAHDGTGGDQKGIFTLKLNTGAQGESPGSIVTVTSAKKVGINETEPDEMLDLRCIDYNPNQSGGIKLSDDVGDNWPSGYYLRTNAGSVPRIAIVINDTEAISCKNGGDVGINVTNPGGLLGLKDAATYLDVDVGGNLTFTDAVTGAKTLAELAADTGITDLVDDTTPTLGGNLDADSKDITKVGDITPHTTNTEVLGSTDLRWQAFLHDVNINGSITIDGDAGITQSETGVTDFDITIVDGIITSFTKN